MLVTRQLDIVQPVEGGEESRPRGTMPVRSLGCASLGSASGGVVATASSAAIEARIAGISRIHLGERGAPDCSAARHGPTFPDVPTSNGECRAEQEVISIAAGG